MKILRLDLKPVVGERVELRVFQDNSNKYEPSRSFPLGEIAKLIERAEGEYYVPSDVAGNYAEIGQQLYKWLNGGSNNELNKFVDRYAPSDGVVLAIAAAKRLAHLPWEVLHDGTKFLVERTVVPVRWVSQEDEGKILSVNNPRKNRALKVLFMASSPIDIKPELNYEAEEARILSILEMQGIGRRDLELIVEESGSISGLVTSIENNSSDHLNSKLKDPFDVLHLTGHGTIKDSTPYFIAEKETGEADYVSASQIIPPGLKGYQPKLVFLSACHTGQASNSGSVPSMAEELLKSGVEAVLGWGYTVSDEGATKAVQALYEALLKGKEVTHALALTYLALIEEENKKNKENKARAWHLLRLYTAHSLPGNLVTLSNRRPARPPSVATEFLDLDTKQIKIATRESFVGRRRQLQKCLCSLLGGNEVEGNKVAILIHGMGGLGKSSLAARLCDRLANFERVVWQGRVDEPKLVKKLSEIKVVRNNQKLLTELTEDNKELRYRLESVFDDLSNNGEKNFLLVLDDFEENLEPCDDGYAPKQYALDILNAIFWAIKKSNPSYGIIITCRYDFNFEYDSDDLGKWEDDIHKQPLDAMRGVDLQKKWDRLTASNKKKSQEDDEKWQSQMKKLADGNPRLLEFLYEKLQKSSDKVETLKRLEANPVELQKKVLTEELAKQIDQPMREILQRGLIFELPVPREALEKICETLGSFAHYVHYIDKAIDLGLLEVSPDGSLRVPRILLLEKLDETSSHHLYQQATEVLYRLWFKPEEEKTPEERLLEIYRLAKLGNVIEIEVEMTEILARRWNSRRSRLREVVELCTSTLDDLKKLYSDDVPKNLVTKIYNVLAFSNLLQENYGEAISNYSTLQKQLSEEEDLDKAKTLDGLGYVYSLTGRYEEAKEMLEQALKIRKEKLKEHPDIAQSLSHLAYWHREQCHWEEAELYYDEALKMYQRLSNEDNLVIAESYHNLGTVYYEQALHYQEQELSEDEQELYKKAKCHYHQALDRSQSLQQQETLSVATFLSSLAKVCYAQESYKEAQNLFVKALNIRRQLLGDHFKIVQDTKNLGFTNYTLEQYPDAERYFCQALNTINQLIKNENSSLDENQDKLVRDVKEILCGLESVYRKQSNSEKATKLGYQKQEIVDDEQDTISRSSISEIIKAVFKLLDYDNKIYYIN
ncbi:hypothetical protein BZZ01_08235 [Nostocales cyanobacterium HT-58-2]|nr:hypothetical protein BZZ01_08235 [Nostocales cyanobacterium HT-58-2]